VAVPGLVFQELGLVLVFVAACGRQYTLGWRALARLVCLGRRLEQAFGVQHGHLP